MPIKKIEHSECCYERVITINSKKYITKLCSKCKKTLSKQEKIMSGVDKLKDINLQLTIEIKGLREENEELEKIEEKYLKLLKLYNKSKQTVQFQREELDKLHDLKEQLNKFIKDKTNEV